MKGRAECPCGRAINVELGHIPNPDAFLMIRENDAAKQYRAIECECGVMMIMPMNETGKIRVYKPIGEYAS